MYAHVYIYNIQSFSQLCVLCFQFKTKVNTCLLCLPTSGLEMWKWSGYLQDVFRRHAGQEPIWLVVSISLKNMSQLE